MTAAGLVPKEGSTKALPKQINQMLQSFACAVYREAAESKAPVKYAIDTVMTFLEPFTSRQNLMVRLSKEWERAQRQEAVAGEFLSKHIKERVDGELLGPSLPAGVCYLSVF